MSLSIASNQQTLGQLLLKDVVTQAPVSATFANTTATSSDSSLFTVDLNSTVDVINVKAVSVGAGTISITSDASYTDSLGAPQTKSLTLSVDVLITQVSADDVALDIRFAAPTPL